MKTVAHRHKKGISLLTATIIVLMLHGLVGLFILVPPPLQPKRKTLPLLTESQKNANVNSEMPRLEVVSTTPKSFKKSKITEQSKQISNPSHQIKNEKRFYQRTTIARPTSELDNEQHITNSPLEVVGQQYNSQPVIITHSPIQKDDMASHANKPLSDDSSYIYNGYVNTNRHNSNTQMIPVIKMYEDEVKRYSLKAGDTLYGVSKKLNVSFQDLVDSNNIRDVRDLREGQVLIVPHVSR